MQVYVKHPVHGNKHVDEKEVPELVKQGWVKWPRTSEEKALGDGSDAAYWRAKIAANRTRDRGVLRTLKAQGWKTLIVWECEIRDAAKLSAKLARFLG